MYTCRSLLCTHSNIWFVGINETLSKKKVIRSIILGNRNFMETGCKFFLNFPHRKVKQFCGNILKLKRTSCSTFVSIFLSLPGPIHSSLIITDLWDRFLLVAPHVFASSKDVASLRVVSMFRWTFLRTECVRIGDLKLSPTNTGIINCVRKLQLYLKKYDFILSLRVLQGHFVVPFEHSFPRRLFHHTYFSFHNIFKVSSGKWFCISCALVRFRENANIYLICG